MLLIDLIASMAGTKVEEEKIQECLGPSGDSEIGNKRLYRKLREI